jgi:RNA polymerase sigma factor (sigma-70 family)
VKTAAKAQLERRKPASSSDERLVALCLKGDEQAWADLIDKYKNLIYSIPIKLGMYEDASDIFQSVCVDLLSDLSKLREPKALPKWLMQVCYHKCLEHRGRAKKQVQLEDEDAESLPADPSSSTLPEEMLAQLQHEQMVRDAVSGLSQRCERMVRMLFFETPPRPYQDVAKELGIATGSIGFIRGRCLTRLKKHLEDMGFQ